MALELVENPFNLRGKQPWEEGVGREGVTPTPLTAGLSLTLLIPKHPREKTTKSTCWGNLIKTHWQFIMQSWTAWAALTGTAGAQDGIEGTRAVQPAPCASIHRAEEMLLPSLSQGSRKVGMTTRVLVPQSIRCERDQCQGLLGAGSRAALGLRWQS